MWWETAIVVVIIAAAVFGVARGAVRRIRGKGACSGCRKTCDQGKIENPNSGIQPSISARREKRD